ncbi:MAG: glycosyltransferase [Pseudomonadota bacterium]
MSDFPVPKVSVCIPVYNGGAYIADAIQSVLDQTYKDFQVVVCDNCSTDNTEELVRSFKDARVRYVRNDKNLGMVGNANRCIELATGEYVHILHHDDVMLPENLHLKVNILDRYPKVGLVHSDVMFIDGSGNPLDLTKFDAQRDSVEDGRTIFRRYVLNMPVGASIFIGAVLARRECYLRLGEFHPALPNTGDSEMWMRIALHYDIACIGKRLVKYRLHNQMTSTAINDSEGLNATGLREHYFASRLVLDRYEGLVPRPDGLGRAVSVAFSMRALRKSLGLLRNGGHREGLRLLGAAFGFYPLIFARREFWSYAASLVKDAIRKLFRVTIGRT